MNITGVYTLSNLEAEIFIINNVSGAFYHRGNLTSGQRYVESKLSPEAYRTSIGFDASKAWTGKFKLLLSYFIKIIYNKIGI